MENEDELCSNQVECESTAVHSYLSILQGVISRMATNSASCKSWCITLVSAIIVVLINKDQSLFILIALLPTILFFFLDSYYLAAERGFRDRYNKFIKKLNSGKADKSDLFIILPGKNIGFSTMLYSFKSISIWPFYLFITVMVIVIWLVFKCSSKAIYFG